MRTNFERTDDYNIHSKMVDTNMFTNSNIKVKDNDKKQVKTIILKRPEYFPSSLERIENQRRYQTFSFSDKLRISRPFYTDIRTDQKYETTKKYPFH